MIEIQDLKKEYGRDTQKIYALNGVSVGIENDPSATDKLVRILLS